MDYEPDGEGGYCTSSWHDDPDTSDTNWADEYKSNGYKTPLQLIELFKQCLEENLKHGLVFKTPAVTEKLIEECGCWIENETTFVEEN